MNGFLYTITIEEPVLANSLGGEPNSAKSLFYLPGSLLRGAAINAYAGKKDAGDENFRRLFLDGRTCYLNAYPLSQNGRSLPIPLKFKKPKYFDASDFGHIQGLEIHALHEELQINIHTQRDASLGHAAADFGAIYRYIALPDGLRLQGAVLTETPADAKIIESLLTGSSILIGKARTAGYGRVTIVTAPLAGWKEGGAKSASSTGFTLIILSPTIVRDAYGQPTLDIEPALSARLGVAAVIKKSFVKPEIVGGFNRTWGLPLPQVTAIAAGCLFELEAKVDAAALKQLEEYGVGERRAEGFGRLAINLALPEKIEDAGWKIVPPQIEDIVQSKTCLGENKIAKLMLMRLLRRDLDEIVISAARTATVNYFGGVPNSQLSRWRVIVRDVLEQHDLPRLEKFCNDSKGKPGWQKMEKARVNFNGQQPRLTEWIEALLNQPEALSQACGAEFKPGHSLGSNSVQIDSDLNVEYRLRLLDAVLALMAKKNGGRNE